MTQTRDIYRLYPRSIVCKDQISESHYSKVYKASYDNFPVVIKLNHSKVILQKEKSFLEILTEKKVPYIVKYFGYYTNAQLSMLLVMEEALYGSLGNVITNYQAIPWDHRYNIMQNMATALAFMHGLGIVHCDLKSFNVLIDKDFQAKLTDFGSAEFISAPSSQRVRTTTAWAAPEVLKSAVISTKADVFSLSMVFWEVAEWKATPFSEWETDADQFAEWRKSHPDERPPLSSSCSDTLRSVIANGWNTDPAKRPGAHQLITMLQNRPNNIPPQISTNINSLFSKSESEIAVKTVTKEMKANKKSCCQLM